MHGANRDRHLPQDDTQDHGDRTMTNNKNDQELSHKELGEIAGGGRGRISDSRAEQLRDRSQAAAEGDEGRGRRPERPDRPERPVRR